MIKKIYFITVFFFSISCSAQNMLVPQKPTQESIPQESIQDSTAQQFSQEVIPQRSTQESNGFIKNNIIPIASALLMLLSVLIMLRQSNTMKQNSDKLATDLQGMTDNIKEQFEKLVSNTRTEFKSLSKSIENIFNKSIKKKEDDETIHKREEIIIEKLTQIGVNISPFIEAIDDNYGRFTAGNITFSTQESVQEDIYRNFLVLHEKLSSDINYLENYIDNIGIEIDKMFFRNLIGQLDKKILTDQDKDNFKFTFQELRNCIKKIKIPASRQHKFS